MSEKTDFLNALDDLQTSIEDLATKWNAAKAAHQTLRSSSTQAATVLDNNVKLPTLARRCAAANGLNDFLEKSYTTSEFISSLRTPVESVTGGIA